MPRRKRNDHATAVSPAKERRGEKILTKKARRKPKVPPYPSRKPKVPPYPSRGRGGRICIAEKVEHENPTAVLCHSSAYGQPDYADRTRLSPEVWGGDSAADEKKKEH